MGHYRDELVYLHRYSHFQGGVVYNRRTYVSEKFILVSFSLLLIASFDSKSQVWISIDGPVRTSKLRALYLAAIDLHFTKVFRGMEIQICCVRGHGPMWAQNF
jgi:hypothetical protein